MTTTLDNVLRAIDAIPHTKRKPYKDGYKFNNPFDSSSDSHSFCLFDIRADGEGATYKYFAGNESVDSGTLYDLAKRLNVPIADNRQQVNPSKRQYSDIADYAQSHGVTVEYLNKCLWTETVYQNRPAIQFKTSGGNRYRFLDTGANKYTSDTGYIICWYGLDDAIKKANELNYDFIVLCNGEISTVSAKYNRIPAFCKTSGESALPENLLDELNRKWSGRVIIALDCDDTGRSSADKINNQLNGNGVIVDLMLSDGGDLADFCLLNTDDSFKNLLALVDKQHPKPELSGHLTDNHRSDKVLNDVIAELRGEKHIKQAGFLFPIRELRQFGGFCELCETGKVTLVAGGSGTGKTQFLETINDILNRRGVSGLWFGSEWRADEMLWRRIQRWSTHLKSLTSISYDDIRKHRLYLKNMQNGVHDDENDGTPLNQSQWLSFQKVIDFLNTFTGSTEYFEDRGSLPDIFEQMKIAIERERRNNREILYVIFDYVQLLKAASPDSSLTRYEYAFELVKHFASEANVHIFMTSQVNKISQSNLSSGKSLNMESAHYVRGDKANLFLTLNRQYYKLDDEYIETNAFYLNVAKSSLGGRPDGYTEPYLRIPMVMNPQELMFVTSNDWREINSKPFSLLPDSHFYTGQAGIDLHNFKF